MAAGQIVSVNQQKELQRQEEQCQCLLDVEFKMAGPRLSSDNPRERERDRERERERDFKCTIE